MGIFPAKRFERVFFIVLADRSVLDNSKVAVSGATIAAYSRGTDVRNNTGSGLASGGSGTINIQHPGDIRVGDTIFKNTTTSQTLTVTALTQNPDLTFTLGVSNASGSSFTWAAGDRLMISSRRPTLYSDAAGSTSLGSSTTSNSSGEVGVYVNASYIDCIISGGTPAVVTEIRRDIPGGERPVVLNLNDYGGSLNTALAAIDGDTFFDDLGVEIYCPPGVYTYDTAELPVVINTRVTIRGAGKLATRFQVNPTPGNEDLNFFEVKHEHVVLQDFYVAHCGASLGVGDGNCIQIGTNATINTVRLSDLILDGAPNAGLKHGTDDAGLVYTDFVVMERCRIGGSQGPTQIEVGSETTLFHMNDCDISRIGYSINCPSGTYCLRIAAAAQVMIENCQFGPSSLNTPAIVTIERAAYPGYSGSWGAQIQIIGCDLEKGSLAAVTTETAPLIYLEGCSGVVVRDTLLYQFGSGILLKNCYAPILENVLLKELGGSGYEIKVDGSKHALVQQCFYEYTDVIPDGGARRPVVITKANDYSGLTVIGNGVSVSYYVNDAARDATTYSAGTDVKGARHDPGTLIWVNTPTSPTSHLQVWDGAAWVGIARQAGGAI